MTRLEQSAKQMEESMALADEICNKHAKRLYFAIEDSVLNKENINWKKLKTELFSLQLRIENTNDWLRKERQ